MVRDLNPNGRGLLNIPFLGLAVGKESWVLTTWPIAKAQRAKKIEYWGHYPVADIEYEIDSPVSVGLRAWCPFLPGDVDSSQLPGAVFEVNLRNLAHSDVKGTLTFSFPGPAIASASAWTRQLRSESRFRGVVLEGRNCSYALGLINEDHVRTGGGIGNDEMAWAAVAERLPREDHRDPGSSVAIDFVLARGQRKAVRFVLAWHTPTWESDFPYGLKLSKYTNRYTQRYTSALELAQKLSEEHVSLLRRVLAWQQVIYTEKDLPIWVRDQLINSLHLITEESY